jgi:hypothetical protein
MLVLLLTVPFQAALGGTGLLCADATHHDSSAGAAPHAHDAAPAGDHHHGGHGHDAPAASADLDAATDSNSHAAHGAAGKCKVCNECCSAAAPILAAMPAVFPPDTPLRVSSAVDPRIVSRAGDGLFRPPRSAIV